MQTGLTIMPLCTQSTLATARCQFYTLKMDKYLKNSNSPFTTETYFFMMTFFLDWPLILRIPHFIYLLLFCPRWGTVLLYLRKKKRPKNFPLCIYSVIYSDWDTLTVFARYHWQKSIAQVVFLETSTEILFHKDILIFHKDFFTKKCHYLL